jgi:hypothetical protein
MKPNARSRPLFQKSLPFRLGLTVGIGLLLVGCGKHYWNKAGAGPSDFNRESAECARENSVQMTANKDYGIVIADLYKMCLKSRGWSRAQQFEPPPAGWFRGIEEDGPMRFEPPAPRSDAPSGPAAVAAELVGKVRGFDLKGAGDIVTSGQEVSLSGTFGQRALPISFTLVVNGSTLEASGLAANNTLYRLSFQRR